MIELWCQGYGRRPKHITLDIEDTVDVVHGHQQLSLFNAHFDERFFLPIHVYDAGGAAARQDAIRQGEPWSSPPADPAHPLILAIDTDHHRRR
jgi:hypothetical protein